MQQLNSDLPNEAIQLAIEELTRDRSTSLENTNREIYQLLKDGVKVSFKKDEEQRVETVKIIDWNTPGNNSFLLASQFTITQLLEKSIRDAQTYSALLTVYP